MRTIGSRSFVSVVFSSLVVVGLLFVLSACGRTESGGTGATTAPTAAPTPTMGVVKDYGKAHGCPSDVVVTTAPTKANVTIVSPSPTNEGEAAAHVGDIIEVRVPFGSQWSGPTTSQGGLELQQPAGYAWPADQVCVWRFVAKKTGETNLSFSARALCKRGSMCPMYIRAMPLTVTVH